MVIGTGNVPDAARRRSPSPAAPAPRCSRRPRAPGWRCPRRVSIRWRISSARLPSRITISGSRLARSRARAANFASVACAVLARLGAHDVLDAGKALRRLRLDDEEQHHRAARMRRAPRREGERDACIPACRRRRRGIFACAPRRGRVSAASCRHAAIAVRGRASARRQPLHRTVAISAVRSSPTTSFTSFMIGCAMARARSAPSASTWSICAGIGE